MGSALPADRRLSASRLHLNPCRSVVAARPAGPAAPACRVPRPRPRSCHPASAAGSAAGSDQPAASEEIRIVEFRVGRSDQIDHLIAAVTAEAVAVLRQAGARFAYLLRHRHRGVLRRPPAELLRCAAPPQGGPAHPRRRATRASRAGGRRRTAPVRRRSGRAGPLGGDDPEDLLRRTAADQPLPPGVRRRRHGQGQVARGRRRPDPAAAAQHICATEGWGPPAGNGDAVRLLGDPTGPRTPRS